MPKTTPICLAIALTATSIGHAQSGHTKRMDAMVLPNETRTFCSSNKKCVLTIKTLDHWKTPYPVATLVVNGKSVWERKIDNWRGPRMACVSDAGRIALFDEWPNSPSQRAITIIAQAGKTKHVWSFDQVVAIAGVNRETVPPQAKLGVWLSSMPVIDDDIIRIKIAGVDLILNLIKASLTKAG